MYNFNLMGLFSFLKLVKNLAIACSGGISITITITRFYWLCMEDLIGSVVSGFAKAIGKLFGSPLDFLAGKSCSSLCAPTWDLFCYIENFCIANLLKLATVAFLFYIVLLFFYILYKLGVCHCICGTICRMIWACFATCFWVCDYGCTFLCYNLRNVKRKRRRRRRDIEELDLTTSEEEGEEEEGEEEEEAARVRYHHRPHGSKSRKWRDYKRDQLRRSLRPRSHRVRVGTSNGDSFHVRRMKRVKHGDQSSTIHDIRLTQTSKFAQKGTNYKGSKHTHSRKMR